MKTVHILILVSTMSLLAACGNLQIGGTLDENVATVNAIATRGAGGEVAGALPDQAVTPTIEPTATPDPYFRDLTLDQSALLVEAWGQVAGQPANTTFTIIATETQLGGFIIADLQLRFSDTINGGSVTLAPGQLRLDMALTGEDGSFGSGTASFQPTINEDGTLRLNPRGANFSGISIPNGLTPAIGSAVDKALTGANPRVSLTALSFDGNRLTVSGIVR